MKINTSLKVQVNGQLKCITNVDGSKDNSAVIISNIDGSESPDGAYIQIVGSNKNPGDSLLFLSTKLKIGDVVTIAIIEGEPSSESEILPPPSEEFIRKSKLASYIQLKKEFGDIDI